jgi:tetratricopeptide (TPR) repeat protein
VTRRTKASLYEARQLLEQSLAIDPNYARAAAMLSRTHFVSYVVPFDGDYLSPPALDRALELAQTAVHLDPRLPQARAALGNVLLFKGQHDAAIAEFERAFALNPNFIDFRYATVLACVGEPARAIEVLEAIIRLDPFPPSPTFGTMGDANYMLKRYRDAVHWHRELLSRWPNAQWAYLGLACAYAQLGQLEEARAAAAEVLRINPRFTIESSKRMLVYKDPRTSNMILMGCARRDCPRVENWRPCAVFMPPCRSPEECSGRGATPRTQITWSPSLRFGLLAHFRCCRVDRSIHSPRVGCGAASLSSATAFCRGNFVPKTALKCTWAVRSRHLKINQEAANKQAHYLTFNDSASRF